jgi:hypothetical protein
MHVPRADWPDQSSAAAASLRKDNKDVSTRSGSSNREVTSLFVCGMALIRRDSNDVFEYLFYLRSSDAVFGAFLRIAVIPIKAGNADPHT